MIAFLDVAYADPIAVAAVVVARRWTDPRAFAAKTARIEPVAPYVPGRFFERELPALLAVLDLLGRDDRPQIVVVDGHVMLGEDRPGLGAHLHRAIGLPVVGVAKTPFAGAPAIEVTRGGSTRPLFVDAIGLDPAVAAEDVRAMHGPSRIPSLLRDVDRLARDALARA
jgi:deoxyribonuclease V